VRSCKDNPCKVAFPWHTCDFWEAAIWNISQSICVIEPSSHGKLCSNRRTIIEHVEDHLLVHVFGSMLSSNLWRIFEM
jgi:hypothetical protein